MILYKLRVNADGFKTHNNDRYPKCE